MPPSTTTRRPAAAGPEQRRGASRRGGARRAVRAVQYGALLALCASLAAWGWLILDQAGRLAAEVLSEDAAGTPVDVLSASRILARGRAEDASDLLRELRAVGYREVSRRPAGPGEYRRTARALEVYRRRHAGPRGEVRPAFVRIAFEDGRVASIEDGGGRRLEAFALEPVRLGAFRGPALEERRPLPLARFPRQVIQAVLAAEDARFLTHRGVDPWGVARAVWVDLTRRGPLQGGSTITQQVIKNRVVGSERTLRRKAHEALLAAYVERRVTKERLLEIYLNEIYLGQRGSVSVVGLPAAALFYFGRNLDEIQVHQAALLAGMIASPGRFDPRRNPDAARGRMRWVLTRMAELGYLGEDAARAAAEAPFALAPVVEPLDPGGDVLDAVRREVVRRGYEPRPGTGAAAIHTTLDVALQSAARRALDATLAELEKDDPRRAPLEGAVVVLRPEDGALLALVGGRGGIRGGFHRALDARRQPGSAFKPFVALEAFAAGGYGPGSVVDDAPLTVATAAGPWSPENYDHRFRGRVTVRRALEESLNVPIARLGLALGAARVAARARDAGLQGRLPEQPSLALGTAEVSPLDLATAYATLAALGTRREPLVVEAVRAGVDAETVPLQPRAHARQVVPPAPCWLVLDALRGTIERGTARSLAGATRGVPVAGKTGTTQDGRDAWFALVTGHAVVIVYVGRDDDRPAGLTGAGAALPVVRRLLEAEGDRLLSPLPAAPPGLTQVEIDPASGGRALPRCPERVPEWFALGSEPADCPAHASPLKRFWNRLTGRDERQKPASRERRDGRDRPR